MYSLYISVHPMALKRYRPCLHNSVCVFREKFLFLIQMKNTSSTKQSMTANPLQTTKIFNLR